MSVPDKAPDDDDGGLNAKERIDENAVCQQQDDLKFSGPSSIHRVETAGLELATEVLQHIPMAFATHTTTNSPLTKEE
ncbi:hypothetical protein PoB_003228000 [Plakobranchus ocellatus]|uniref:Uncharacterized protein n=1 Tax=Plakobranchus ocellatus TaxID=259542 RepID=A0AAV4AG94_9GAST|nr:hypothetical protein PoB_003228000 [Plakobranchus ocellatus]